MNTPAFSVLLSVYQKEQPDYLRAALESLERQTLRADEYVIICDGPLTPALDQVLTDFAAQTDVETSIYRFDENRGLGLALADGVERAKYDWIARMDTDDIALPERFETQWAYLVAHPETELLGSAIEEFDTDPEQPYARRDVPETQDAIVKYAGRRNPFNHMTVIYQKEAVLAAGNYRHLPGYEDYYLWTRMLKNGTVAHNLPAPLVRVRADRAMYDRRGGFQYFKDGVAAYNTIYQVGLATPLDRLIRIGGQAVVNLLPNRLRRSLYQRILRNNAEAKGGAHE